MKIPEPRYEINFNGGRVTYSEGTWGGCPILWESKNSFFVPIRAKTAEGALRKLRKRLKEMGEIK